MTSSLQGAGREQPWWAGETKPGQGLDLRVAVVVMGFVEDLKYDRLLAPKDWPDAWDARDSAPPFSTDIRAAFLVVEKMRSDHWFVEITERPGGLESEVVLCRGFDERRQPTGTHLYASAPTAPLAISLAALASVSLTDKET